jgi:hypothetical protein
MSAFPSRRYRVVVLEWLLQTTVVAASSKEGAEAKGLALWNQADGSCSFEDQGVDGVVTDEL